MAMQLRIVCPEECVFEGDVAYVAVPTSVGQFGILPRHASEICTIDAGHIRVADTTMSDITRVFAVSEGYVQVANDEVIVLVDRAADVSKVDEQAVQAQLSEFEEQLSDLPKGDARRAYLYNEIAWCKLLLAQ